MNLVALSPLWLLAILAAALCAAAIEDAARLRISNITCLAVLAGAICAAVIHGLDVSLWQNVAVFLLVLVIGTVAFSAGWLGGGDVKLFAATALWFDFRAALWFVSLVFIAGGLLGIIYIMSRILLGRGATKKRNSRHVPYGIAIAMGAILLIGISREQPQQTSLERSIPIRIH